jgi:hypothetical protein
MHFSRPALDNLRKNLATIGGPRTDPSPPPEPASGSCWNNNVVPELSFRRQQRDYVVVGLGRVRRGHRLGRGPGGRGAGVLGGWRVGARAGARAVRGRRGRQSLAVPINVQYRAFHGWGRNGGRRARASERGDGGRVRGRPLVAEVPLLRPRVCSLVELSSGGRMTSRIGT